MSVLIPGLFGLDSASAWRALQKDPQKYIDRFSKDKTVQKEIEYFAKKAPTLTSVDALMKDRRALQFVLDSYGLGSEINNAGRIRKVLSENPAEPGSLVNRLADTKFKTLASALRLDVSSTKLQGMVTNGELKKNYIQNEFEEALGQQDNALRQAAYFARNASTISSVYGILGDKVIRDVVTNTFNLPAQIAIQPIESQAKLIASKVDFKKFSALTGNATVSATQLANAKSDYALIEKNLGISDAAMAQIKSVQDKLNQLATDYTHLGTITDPMGSNQQLIAIQENAVPDLIGHEQTMRSAKTAISSVQSGMTSLQNLINQVSTTSDLAGLKTQFTNLVNSLTSQINNAGTLTPDGSTQNILLNGSNDTVTTTFSTSGASVTVNRYDGAALQNFLSTASTAFNAITDSSDTSSILQATSRILQGSELATNISTKITDNQNAMNTALNGSNFFVATLNSTELLKGKQSIDDGLSRISQIETVLTTIGKLATQSKNMAADADRTALETQFSTLKTQLRDLIEDAGPGLDNFLDNIPDQNYEIINGQSVAVKGGFNLRTMVADVIDAGSLSDSTAAAALEISAIQVTTQTDRAKKALNDAKPIMDRIVSTYDPRGKLDNKIFELKSQIETLISGAAKDGVNLLGVTQADIKLSGLSTGTSLSFKAQKTFKADYTDALNDILAQLGNGPNAIIGAVDDALDIVNRVARNLSGDNRAATIEYGRLGGTIDTLEPKQETSSALYKTNEFTAKFISRYLVQAGGNGSSAGGANAYMMNLFGGSGDPMSNIFSLVGSLKA